MCNIFCVICLTWGNQLEHSTWNVSHCPSSCMTKSFRTASHNFTQPFYLLHPLPSYSLVRTARLGHGPQSKPREDLSRSVERSSLGGSQYRVSHWVLHCRLKSWTLSCCLSTALAQCYWLLKSNFETIIPSFSSVQSLSCVRLCNPMNRSTPGLPVQHHLPEFTQTHVHWVRDAIQPSHPLSSPSPALNPSQHQSLFQWVNSSHEVAKVDLL